MRWRVWLWPTLLVLGGCALIEGVRQSAQVGVLRAEEQQKRSDVIVARAADSQNALVALREVIETEEDTETGAEIVALIEQLEEAQSRIVSEATTIGTEARSSEEWNLATGEALGEPKEIAQPGTPEEEMQRMGFLIRARAMGKLRRASQTLARGIFTSPNTRRNSRSGQGSSSGWLLTIAGTVLGIGGAGGTGMMLGRRALRKMSEGLANAGKNRDDQQEEEIAELRDQVTQLTNLLETLREQQENPEA